MTQEQKARAYDKVRENIAIRFGSNVAEEIFSEFEMSEDERIRKELIEFVKSRGGFKQEYIAWLEKQGTSYTKRDVDDAFVEGMAFAKYELEKQGKQKPVVIIPKFRVGDEVITENEESLTITRIDEKGYWSNDLFICSFDDSDEWELVEKKELKKIENRPMLSDFFNAEYERGKADALQSIKWSEEDKDYYDAIITKLEVTQDDAGLTDNQMEFLKSIKQRIGG